jgi:NAD(P)H-dependent flavin oxidoreductase YrpB (nitropropane dioxygenase family)
MRGIVTPFTRLLGIAAPIVQAPIGSATTPELVAAVSNAGGLGMHSITWRPVDEARALIRDTKSLTGKPFGVNIVLEWDPADLLQVAIDERVPLISFFWGDPAPYVAAVKSAGLLVSHTAGSAVEAVAARDAGVDVIVAQGWEAGGHVWGNVATMPLVPAIVDAVPSIPVIAAGGIADGRGLAAALALGASGAWMGTRFLLASESPIHPWYRTRLLSASETATEHTRLFDGGWPNAALRTLRNETLRKWEAAGRPPSGSRPGEGEVIAHRADGSPVLRYHDDFPMTGVTGDLAGMVQYAGQGVGLIRESLPAARIVQNVVEETYVAMRRLALAIDTTGV